MRTGVVVLDVQEVGGLTEGRDGPIQVAQPTVDGRIARADIPDVALEMLNVHGLEPREGGRGELERRVSVALGEEQYRGCRKGERGYSHRSERW